MYMVVQKCANDLRTTTWMTRTSVLKVKLCADDEQVTWRLGVRLSSSGRVRLRKAIKVTKNIHISSAFILVICYIRHPVKCAKYIIAMSRERIPCKLVGFSFREKWLTHPQTKTCQQHRLEILKEWRMFIRRILALFQCQKDCVMIQKSPFTLVSFWTYRLGLQALLVCSRSSRNSSSRLLMHLNIDSCCQPILLPAIIESVPSHRPSDCI